MNGAACDAELEEPLARVWAPARGFTGFLTNVNHRVIGARFMVTAFVFFLVAGLEALLLRVQLLGPRGDVLDPERFNQLFTMHGSTMMFLFAVPFLEGLSIYVVPLMIGTRDMAFPRLNAFGYWVYLVAGVALHVALLAGFAPDAGWFAYPPLSGPGYSTGLGLDYWVTMITFIELSALAAAVELIVTILKQRAPGMSLHRMPIFVWGALVTSFMIVFAMPPLIVTSLMLGLDRFAGMHFFSVAAGGEPLLWQHLFWFFGHPDVYLMLVPALGIVSTIVPASVRRPLSGYSLVVGSLVAIAVISFGLWVHHMYAAGLPLLGTSFFAAASMMITIPSSIVIVAWIHTIWKGRPRLDAPFLFVVGALVTFILGGITGVMVASPSFDLSVHDTYFVVAHFHYVLIGGVVFPIFAAIHFWFPKITGRAMSERLGKLGFATVFVGFHATFLPMHVLGLLGMPRRVYTYLPGLGWTSLNAFIGVSAFVLGLGVLIVVVNMVWSFFFGSRAASDPWGASTLEWSTTSPPPPYNFARIPVVRGREPLWDEARRSIAMDDPADVRRELLVTTTLDAAPDHRAELPGPTVWPLLVASAAAVSFLGAMVDLMFVPIGGLLALVALIGWAWPTNGLATGGGRASEPGDADLRALPRVASGRRAAIWWGVCLLVVIEAIVVLALVTSYFYLASVRGGAFPEGGAEAPDATRASVGLALALASLLPIHLAERAAGAARARSMRAWLLCAVALELGAVLMSALDAAHREPSWTSHAYGSILWTISGYQALHGLVAACAAALVLALSFVRRLDGERRAPVSALRLYWDFVVAATVIVFFTLYLSPHLL